MSDQPNSADLPKESPSSEKPEGRSRRSHWLWPLGLALAGAGSAAAFMLRGCWHLHMSWPTSYDDEFSYQVCTNCGIKRLFDQSSFHAYGPYGYEVTDLIARERAARIRRLRKHEEMTKKKVTSNK